MTMWIESDSGKNTHHGLHSRSTLWNGSDISRVSLEGQNKLHRSGPDLNDIPS